MWILQERQLPFPQAFSLSGVLWLIFFFDESQLNGLSQHSGEGPALQEILQNRPEESVTTSLMGYFLACHVRGNAITGLAGGD